MLIDLKIKMIILVLMNLFYISKISLSIFSLIQYNLIDSVRITMYMSIGSNTWFFIGSIYGIIINICNCVFEKPVNVNNNTPTDDTYETNFLVLLCLILLAAPDLPYACASIFDIIQNKNIPTILMTTFILTYIVTIPGSLILAVYIILKTILVFSCILTCGFCGTWCK